MAQRKRYTASLDTGETRTTFAWNSAITATQEMVRAIGRAEGQTYSAAWPMLDGQPATAHVKRHAASVLTRVWTGDRTGATIVASVTEEVTA